MAILLLSELYKIIFVIYLDLSVFFRILFKIFDLVVRLVVFCELNPDKTIAYFIIGSVYLVEWQKI